MKEKNLNGVNVFVVAVIIVFAKGQRADLKAGRAE